MTFSKILAQRPSAPISVPAELSGSPAKRYRFAQECYVQEAWNEFSTLAGSATVPTLSKSTFILFKPDAAPPRAIEVAIDALGRQGFLPTFWKPFVFNRHTIRELWRYEFNLATLSRYCTIDALLTAGTSLFLALHASDLRGYPSASARLADFKGKSLLKDRTPGSLRAQIGARDGLLNYIHTPDESLDLIREVAVLFDRADRNAIWNALIAGTSTTRTDLAQTLDEEVYRGVEEHPLVLEYVIKKYRRFLPLISATQSLPSYPTPPSQSLAAEILDTLTERDVSLSLWDRLTLLCVTTETKVPGIPPILEYEDEYLFDSSESTTNKSRQ